MKETNKWQYKGLNMNLSDIKNVDYQEKQELLAIIDESQKTELKEIFENGFTNNYERYKKYLYESNLFMFKDLEFNIKESVNCLIFGAFIASITNTNLILERAIKLALIQFEVGELTDYNNDEIIKKYIEADKKFSGKNIESNIQTCLKYKILNSEEAQELREYKLKFRDGFSHFTPRNILKDENNLVHTELDSSNLGMDKHFRMPTFQSAIVRQFAKNNSEKHLVYVLEIINHLQYKLLEKFRKI